MNMFKMTRMIHDTLKRDGKLKVFTVDGESSSAVWVQFMVGNADLHKIYFISQSDNNDVTVRIPRLACVARSRVADVLPVLNQLNREKRFLKFALGKGGYITVTYDCLESCADPVSNALEIMCLMVDIVNDAYPQIMSVLSD